MNPETRPETLLSIVTIHKGNEENLVRTLNSMSALSHLKQFSELIVVNANTYEYIFNSDSFVSYKQFISVNSGIFHAMNFGLAECIGKYVVFVNSGDLISTQMNPDLILLQLRKSTTWFVAKSKRVNSRKSENGDWFLPKSYRRFYFAINSYCHQSTFVSREKLTEVGGFQEDNSVADWEVSLNLYQFQKPEIVDTYWAEYAGQGFSDSPDMKVWSKDVSNSRIRSDLSVPGGVKVDQFTQKIVSWLLIFQKFLSRKKDFGA